MSGDDVVITGTGIFTTLGIGSDEHLRALEAGVTKVVALPDAPADSPMALGARIEAPYLRVAVPEDLESQVKFLNPGGALAVTAAALAIEAAGGLGALAALPAERRSLYLAQTDSADLDCRQLRPGFVASAPADGQPWDVPLLNREATRRTKPFFLLEGLKNNSFSFIAKWFDLQGANTSISGNAHAGFHALERAVRALRDRRTDLALVVGSAFVTEPIIRREMASLGLVDRGSRAIPGDGAAALVLERRTDAEARGAEPIATWIGSAARSGPFHDHRPAPETIAAAFHGAGAPEGLHGMVVPVAFEPADLDAGTPDHRPFERAIGHLDAAKEVVDLVLTIASAGPGETWALLSYGFLGQAGAIVVRRT